MRTKHLENQRSMFFKVNQLIILSRDLIDTLESGIKGGFNNWWAGKTTESSYNVILLHYRGSKM